MFLNWENEQDRLTSPKLVLELTENTLSMQGIAITRSCSDIMSAITKIRPQQKADFCDEIWYLKYSKHFI